VTPDPADALIKTRRGIGDADQNGQGQVRDVQTEFQGAGADDAGQRSPA
jgi:hypothetical protein